MTKVKTTDGKEFELSSYCIELSEELRGPEASERADDEVVDVAFSSEIFQHVVDYMLANEEYFKANHKEITDPADMHPIPAEFRHFGRAVQVCLLGIRDYERKYLDRFGTGDKLNVELIIDVLLAADSLQVMGLSELLARRMAEFMRARRPEFIREHFKIPASTPELSKQAAEMFPFYSDIKA